jgi:hypothetical protein
VFVATSSGDDTRPRIQTCTNSTTRLNAAQHATTPRAAENRAATCRRPRSQTPIPANPRGASSRRLTRRSVRCHSRTTQLVAPAPRTSGST